jgi:hypothetical protein
MSDSKRHPLERVGSTFSDDIETICAQIGFDPSLYIEFPRKRGSLSLAPEAVSAPGLAPEPEAVPASAAAVNQAAQPAVAVNPAVAETPAASTPAVPLPAPTISEAAKQPPASEIVEQTQLQQAVHSSWTGLSSAAAAPVHTRVPASSAVPTRTAQPLYPPRPVRPAQPLPIARPPGVPNVAPDAPAPAPPAQRQLAVQGLRAGLRALLEELGGEERSTEQHPQRRARALVMTPAVSGMGCTTLTATLARYYQNRGEGVLIFDDREDGLLRLHFEAADSVAIPIMSRESAPTLSITWFQEPMVRHQLDYRWFLMDTKSVTPALVNAQLSPGSCYLVPVLADMRGVKAAVQLSEQLDSYESEQGRRLAFYFVLNQFDRASRLQEEMRQHLMRRLGGRLAPVSIRWSEEVGAALAEGTTVLDYAPESPASQDFESLGEWLAGLG